MVQLTILEKVAYLNLENPHPNSPLTCAIFGRATNRFGNLKALEGKQVEVKEKIRPIFNAFGNRAFDHQRLTKAAGSCANTRPPLPGVRLLQLTNRRWHSYPGGAQGLVGVAQQLAA